MKIDATTVRRKELGEFLQVIRSRNQPADFGFPADPVRINEPGRNAWMKLDFSY